MLKFPLKFTPKHISPICFMLFTVFFMGNILSTLKFMHRKQRRTINHFYMPNVCFIRFYWYHKFGFVSWKHLNCLIKFLRHLNSDHKCLELQNIQHLFVIELEKFKIRFKNLFFRRRRHSIISKARTLDFMLHENHSFHQNSHVTFNSTEKLSTVSKSSTHFPFPLLNITHEQIPITVRHSKGFKFSWKLRLTVT